MLYEMKFEIDEPQFTQREILGVIDLPATTVNTWIKRNLLDAFEFARDFRDDKDHLLGVRAGSERFAFTGSFNMIRLSVERACTRCWMHSAWRA